MIVNQLALLSRAPIRGMVTEKLRSAAGYSSGLSECGYDIRINQDIYFNPGGWLHEPFVTVTGAPEEQEKTLVESIRSYGRFTLASAMEEFDMPNDLVGVVHDKSSWARQGLSVFNTVIEPGWKGFLTLELVFHGNQPVHIKRGDGIAQVLFSSLSCPVSYNGVYQNQANKPVPAAQKR